jgi:LysM repeat protein
VRVVEVQPGDTLYGIAGQVAEPGHVRDMVLHIQQLNSLSGATLQVGQKLAIPKS